MKIARFLYRSVLKLCFCLFIVRSVFAEGNYDQTVVEQVFLWPAASTGINVDIKETQMSGAPERIRNIHNPSLTVFRPDKPNGAALIICPGGAYRFVSIEKGGRQIAKRFAQDGITTFVLKYRLPTTKGVNFSHPVPLSDALRAIQWVRFNREAYGVDADKIGIMGFSAGGHLAATAITLYDDYSFGEDAISEVSSRPDFACLGFPVISTDGKIAHGCIKALRGKMADLDKLSAEKNVDSNTPPTFLFHAKDDNVVKYQNSVVMHEALKRVEVPNQLKLYEEGKHGFGLGEAGMDSANWPNDFLNWMAELNLIQASGEFYTPEEDLVRLKTHETRTVSGLPNILIIGDSISGGYTPYVTNGLKGVANLKRIRENGGDTRNGLAKLKKWLGKTKWDVIHFNWGLHDLCYRHPEAKVYGKRDKINGTQSVPLQEYTKNLEQLVIRLKETGAQLIWASTTLVPEGEAGRIEGDEVRYNEAAALIMKKHGIPTNDLHAASLKLTEEFTAPADVHFTKEGSKKLADQVVREIKLLL